jgi:hypothetical protein
VWKKIDDYTYEFASKSANGGTNTGRIVIAKDGKSMTRTTSGKNAQGQFSNTIVHEKQ